LVTGEYILSVISISRNTLKEWQVNASLAVSITISEIFSSRPFLNLFSNQYWFSKHGGLLTSNASINNTYFYPKCAIITAKQINEILHFFIKLAEEIWVALHYFSITSNQQSFTHQTSFAPKLLYRNNLSILIPLHKQKH